MQKAINRSLRKEVLSFAYYAAAIAGLAAAIYLRIYWGAFFVSPFPLITPVQLLGYAVNVFLGIVLVSILSFFIGRLVRASENQSEVLVRNEPESNQQAVAPPLPVPFRKLFRWLRTREAGVNTLFFASILLIVFLGLMLVASGPPQLNAVYSSRALVPLALLITIAVLRVFCSASVFSFEPLLLSLVLMAFAIAGDLAISKADLLWKGGNRVVALFSPGQERTYGYIGELGSRTYLLEESSDSRKAMRVISVASSKVDSLKSPFWEPFPWPQRRWWRGDIFQFGP